MEQILDTKKASAMPPATPNNTPVDNIPVGYNCITSTQDNQSATQEFSENTAQKIDGTLITDSAAVKSEEVPEITPAENSKRSTSSDLPQIVPRVDTKKADVIQSEPKQNLTGYSAVISDVDIIPTSKIDSQARDNERVDCMDELISTKDAAQILGVSSETLKQWRTRKLFGVKFFLADVKRGNTWYYYRERVEQLKAVYNKGTLQNVYKLARLNSENFQKSVTSSSIEKIFYEGDEVAEILGVVKSTLHEWRKSGYFKPAFVGHEGTYYYSEDRVKEFAAARNICIEPLPTDNSELEDFPISSEEFAAQDNDTPAEPQIDNKKADVIQSTPLNNKSSNAGDFVISDTYIITTSQNDSQARDNERVDCMNNSSRFNPVFYPEITDADIANVKKLTREERYEIIRQLNLLNINKINPVARDDKPICPICGNGSGRDGTGVEVHETRDDDGDLLLYWYKCFVCDNFQGTLSNVISRVHNLNWKKPADYLKAIAIAKKILDFADNSDIKATPPVVTTYTNEKSPEELQLIKDLVTSDKPHGLIWLSIQDRRGLHVTTLEYFHCRYVANWAHPLEIIENKFKAICSRRLIIPTSERHYLACLLDAYRTDANKKFWKMHAGHKEPFNFDSIIAGVNIIVEGEIDAMSIWQVTFKNVCALGGAQSDKFLSMLNEKFPQCDSRLDVQFIVLLDSDDTGRTKAPLLRDELIKFGYPATCKFLFDEVTKTDANDILRDKGGTNILYKKLKEIMTTAQVELDHAREKILSTPKVDDDNAAHHVVLTEELAKINKAIADFDAEKSAAIETLKNLETFGSDLVFADEIINAAAFAKLYDRENYSAFIRDVKLYGDKHPAEKAMINDLKAVVKDAAVEIAARDTELHFQRSSIGGKISTKNFLKQLPPELQNITIPADYSLSLENGITRIDRQGKKPKILPVCARPVIIARKTKDVAEKKFKWILLHWTSDGKIFSLPPFDASILCSARRIVDIANYGLPVSSEDAFYLAGYLNRFHVANENSIPQTCTVSHCGWHTFNDADIFVDPRRNSTIEEGGKNYPLIAAETSNFARTLTSKGKLSEWKKAYDLARISPISRCIVAASVAAPLLKVLGEINFLLYIHTTTGAGKTTSLYLGASAVGSEKMIRSFDATKNGLLGAAADVSDYSFLVDEKQTADNRLKDQLSLLVMALANGIGRTKLNSDSTVKNLTDWRTIAIMTGETTLLADNATGGTFRRTLQLRAPKVILPPATCKAIKDIIKENYGLVFAPLIDKIFAYGKDNLRTAYQKILSTFTQSHSAVLDEYRRYIAIISLADYLLNIVLGDDEKSAADSALANADEIFKFVPTNEEIDDAARALAFLKSFVAGHTKHFYTMPSGTTTPAIPQANEVYGQIDFTDEVLFLPHALKKILENEGGFSATKIIADFAERGYLIKSSGRGNYYRKRNFGGNGATTRTDVYRFKAGILRGDDDIPATTAEEIKSFDEEFQGVDLPDGQSPFDFDN